MIQPILYSSTNNGAFHSFAWYSHKLPLLKKSWGGGVYLFLSPALGEALTMRVPILTPFLILQDIHNINLS